MIIEEDLTFSYIFDHFRQKGTNSLMIRGGVYNSLDIHRKTTFNLLNNFPLRWNVGHFLTVFSESADCRPKWSATREGGSLRQSKSKLEPKLNLTPKQVQKRSITKYEYEYENLFIHGFIM